MADENIPYNYYLLTQIMMWFIQNTISVNYDNKEIYKTRMTYINCQENAKSAKKDAFDKSCHPFLKNLKYYENHYYFVSMIAIAIYQLIMEDG